MLHMGVNRSDFEILESAFNRIWTRKGRRIFSSQDVLGLSRVWMNSTCRQKHLVSGFVNGLNLPMQNDWDADFQNAD